ncbi:MAG: nucleotide-diphospho-sugar transferase [Cyclobacteriaceae bacterium]
MPSFVTTATLHVPVLLVIFNRPSTTKLVFEAIRLARPPRLYIAADGPRPEVERDVFNCAQAREIVNHVDWDCEVKTLFREKNLNCGIAPSSAFTWFFEHEEEGIILEDDCLPSQSFFLYCQELLERYRDDTRVMHIGGNNFLNGWEKDKDYSYYFSRSGHIWGWATWRRAWKHFDFGISLYQQLKREDYFASFFMNWPEKVYRMRKFEKTVDKRRKVDWWDYQWDFARYTNSGLAIVPKVNLVKNLGFGEMATHTKNDNTYSARLEGADIELPLKHPPFMMRDLEADRRYFKNFLRDVVLSKLK